MYFTFLLMIHPHSDSRPEPPSTILSFCRFLQIILQTSCFHLKPVSERKPDFAFAAVLALARAGVLLPCARVADGGHVTVWTLPHRYLSNL